MNTRCSYNAVFIKFNEFIEYKPNLYANMSYPSFHKLKNCNCNVNKTTLDNLNQTINLQMYTFKDEVEKEEIEEIKVEIAQHEELVEYKLLSDYSVTFNKSGILSTNVNLLVFTNKKKGLLYNEIYNYNIDLETGNQLSLSDIFVKNVDYLKVCNAYVNYKVKQNPKYFYDGADIEVAESQSFYLTDDALVLYFNSNTIAPKEFGNPKFRMEYKKFLPYFNPKFYCTPQNLHS